MSAKYIIIDRIKPIIFTQAIMHCEESIERNITSAGFVDITTFNNELIVTCWGASNSLGINSNPSRDAKLIKSLFL